MKYIQFNQSEIQSTLEYWTDERMANAIPTPLPQFKIPKRSQQKYDEFFKAETAMSFCGSEDEGYENLNEFLSSEDEGCEHLNAFRTNVNNDPYKKAGKLYYTKSDGKNHTCTAQFVGARHIIMTAAHCIKNSRGKWATHIMFVRAAHDEVGGQNFKVAVSAAGINEEWDSDRSYPYRMPWDYAFARTTPDSDVGSLQLSLNLPNQVRSIGYPSNYGNMYKYMYETNGFVKRCKEEGGDRIACMQGNLKDGASGGAWFPLHSDEVVGINSGHFGGTMFGPIFDRDTLVLFQRFYSRSARQQKNWLFRIFE